MRQFAEFMREEQPTLAELEFAASIPPSTVSRLSTTADGSAES